MICRAPPMRAPCTIDSPTPPQPKTATVCPASRPGAPERRPDPGEDPAAHERGAIQRQVVVDLHHRVLVQQHALGIAADARERRDPLPLLRQPRGRRLARAPPPRRRRHSGGRSGTGRSFRRSRTGTPPRGRRAAAPSPDRRPPRRCPPPRGRARCRGRAAKRPSPSTTCRSLWQTPVATVRTRTSRPSGRSMSMDSMFTGTCVARQTAALISMVTPPRVVWARPEYSAAAGPRGAAWCAGGRPCHNGPAQAAVRERTRHSPETGP